MVRLSVSFVILMSFVSTSLTIANAFFLKKQFYPSVVYLTKSSTSMAVIYFQAAVLSYLIFSVMRWIFFGQLRAAEIEHAQERVWHAVMETCLAFTVFRDDFSPKFVVQFVVLFFVKAFHWLSEDRVDYMERSPVITLLFHARIMGILSLLSAVDSYFISHAFFTTLMRGASAQIVFGFEYAVLLTMVAHITIKYILHIHDLRSPHPWENKAVYMLYAELFANFLRCALYLVFAIVMVKIHTFPLFAIRPFYLTIRALQRAINDVVLSRRAINAMNNLFPLATAQELIDGDATCIICREEMTVESGAKKLPCNHIFHPNCLRSWFQRQQTCPTCRMDVLINRPQNTGLNNANGLANGGINNQAAQQAQQNIFNPAAGFFNFGVNFPAMQQQQQPGVARPNVPNGQQQQPNQQQHFQPNQFFQFGFPPPPPPMMHFHALQQQQVAQAQQNNQQQANGQTGAQQPAGSQLPQAPPPFMPFFPGAAIPPFPFPQPPLFAGFSDAEINEMEGSERQAVEARIQALRNISTLLDAAVLQFQQYTSLAPPRPFPSVPVNPVASTSGATGSVPATSSQSAAEAQESTMQQSSSGPSASILEQSTTNVEESVAQPSSSSLANSGTASKSAALTPESQESAAADEIRRRRLAKFVVVEDPNQQQQPTSSNQADGGN